MRFALVIAAKDLRQRLRDRSALILAFVAPVGLALIISFAFGGDTPFRASFSVYDADQSELSRVFTDEVLGSETLQEAITVREAGSPEEARSLTADGEVAAAFLIPEGFEQAVQTGQGSRIEVLRDPGSQIGAEVAEAIAGSFASRLNAVTLSVVTTLAATDEPDLGRIGELAAAAAATEPPIRLVEGTVGGQQTGPANYFGPAMAVFFLFFTLGFGAQSLLAERRNRTLARLLGAPIPGWSILVGKTIPSFVLGVASLGVMFVVLGALVGVSWGDPLAVATVSVFTVFALFGVMALVGSLTRTDQQAASYTAVVGVFLAIVGGSFFPIDELPTAFQGIARVTPNGQAILAFTELAFEGGGVLTVLSNLTVLAAFGVVTTGAALIRARKLLTP